MNRRGFLTSMIAGAAAVLGAGAVKAEASELPEVAQVRAILAEPERHPEIMARAHELMGESGYMRILDARAEGYADGYTQGRQRAESRVAEGLPLTP